MKDFNFIQQWSGVTYDPGLYTKEEYCLLYGRDARENFRSYYYCQD